MRLCVHVATLVLALVSCATPSLTAALLAIDYGTDSFKASLVKPGVPFDVIINTDSKRKTPSLVTMRGEDRSFGGEAANLATRFPKDTFSAVKLLLGHPSTHSQALLHHSLYGARPATTERGSPAVTSSKGSFPVEEVLAMQLTYAKELADSLAKEAVRDVVVTVPGWFTQSERQAVLDAIELAGLRSLGLVNDGTAAAVNYAMSRNFPAEQSYHLLYDFGAASLRTTLVSLKSALLPDPLSLAAKPELKNVTSLTVHGFGYDTSVGGYVFDGLVRDMMRQEFEKATGKKVEGDARAMAKLLREASRVKQVLSANIESTGRIEGLIDDMDLRVLITREQFEARAAELASKFTKPIHDAFVGTSLSLQDVESVILIGGSSRVPMVEAAVRAAVGEARIAKNLNADEAAVMGAALYGAGISRGFRTKDIRVQDVTPFGIDVSYEADRITEDAEPRTINTHLFPAFAKTGTKKTMTFKKTGDFAIQFAYRRDDKSSPSELPDQLFETKITGLDSAFTNLTAEAVANATVKVTIELNESNLVSVNRAVVVLREEEDTASPSFNDKLKGLLGKFGGGSKGEKTDTTKTGEDGGSTTSNDDDPDSPIVENPFGDLNDTDQAATRAKLEELMRAAVPANSTVRLSLETVVLERKPMTTEDKMASRKSLREVKQAETRKLAREEARNVLEAYIYRVRDLVEDQAFVEASLESERKVIRDKAEAANEWLWDEADKAATKDLKARKSELEKLVKHITVRTAEASQRPKVIDAFNAVLLATDGFLASARENNTASEKKQETPKYTADELAALVKLKSDASDWFATTLKQQNALRPYDDPVLRVADLDKKAKELETEMSRLMRKKVPRRPRSTTATSSSAAPSQTTASDGSEESNSEGPKVERKKDEL